jgi:hypothetical protein
MAPKRKSDAMEQSTLDLPPVAVLANSKEVNVDASAAEPIAKKSRVADASASTSKGKGKAAPRDWRDIKLDGEDEVRVFAFSLLQATADEGHIV